jgi:hypothetical protein
MAARILHFGLDQCHRIAVLRRAGFYVTEAASLYEVHLLFRSRLPFDAVVVSEDDRTDPREVLELVQRKTKVPVLLFRKANREIDRRGFSYVSQPLDSPGHWLNERALLVVGHSFGRHNPAIL